MAYVFHKIISLKELVIGHNQYQPLLISTRGVQDRPSNPKHLLAGTENLF